MKKRILAAVFTMAIVFGASAQDYKWFIGGQAGFWAGKDNTSFTVAPEVGYNINSNLSVAASLGLHSSKIGGASQTGFIVNPYARYTFLKSGIVSAFVDGGVTLGLGDLAGMQLGFSPGIAISLTERFSAVVHCGFLGYNDGKGINNSSKGFGLNLSGYQSSIGFYYSF
jgi:hypothetical protein